MNNENQVPELPKVNDNKDEVQVVENNIQEIELPKQQEENKQVIEEVKKSVSKEFENTGKIFTDIKNYLTTRDSSELFSLLWRLLIIVGFIVILYFPVQVIMDLGINIFMLLGIEYTTRVAAIWTSLLNIIYGILALFLFYYLCKDRYYKLVNNKSENTTKNTINN